MSSGDKKLDAEVVEALSGLERSIPDGYFDQFPRNIGVRLEVEVMDGRTLTHTDTDTTEPFELAARTGALAETSRSDTVRDEDPQEDHEENSGLHEIKALANTAKQRHSRRITTQSDAEESLLVSVSSAALSAVVLPEPGKEVKGAVSPQAAVLGTASNQVAVATAAATGSSFTGPRKPTSVWMIASVGVVLAAAAAVTIIFVKQGGEEVAVSKSDIVAEVVPAATAPAGAADEAPPAPPAEPGALIGVEDDSDEEADSSADAPSDVEPNVAAIADGTVAPRKAPASDRNKAVSQDSSTSAKASSTTESRRDRRAKEKAKKEKAKKDKVADKKTRDSAPEGKKGEADPNYKAAPKGASIDDVLDSVTGGANEQKGNEKESNKPTKTSIGRRDVTKAMGRVRGAAMACYKVEEFVGSVQVKFTVKPSGSISNVKGVGKHKSSKTGKCVVSAVKRAKFPAFSGPPMSFTFPFLLSQP